MIAINYVIMFFAFNKYIYVIYTYFSLIMKMIVVKEGVSGNNRPVIVSQKRKTDF